VNLPTASLITSSAKLKVSVCICTHNGASRLPAVLEALARQTADPDRWELLVIDNASADDTVSVTTAFLEQHFGKRGRVIPESRLGQSFARSRAAMEAGHEIVSFLDDDNVAADDFVEMVLSAFERYPRAGAIGGQVLPEWQKAPTPLAESVAGYALAICEMGDRPFVHEWIGTGPVGAGLCIRRDLLRGAYDTEGFSAAVTGRQGQSLMSGDDMALAIYVAQAGYERRYEPSMILRHQLPPGRMEKGYLMRLYEGIGRGQARTRRLYARAGQSRLVALLVAGKDSLLWLIKGFRPPQTVPRDPQCATLRRDLRDLERRLLLGRIREAVAFGFRKPSSSPSSPPGRPAHLPALESQPLSAASATDPTLSVVICTYNNSAGLAETLRHLRQQDPVPVRWEIIVVDNNCTDDTAAVLASAAQEMPELRCVREDRQGQMHARISGVRASRADVIAFVDDDNYLAQDWIAQALDFLANHPACGVFGGRIEILWETPPPPEIARRQYAYASTNLAGEACQLVDNERWNLRGAGLVCRKAPLLASGWLEWQLCVGRIGHGCMAGDDTEIVMRIARQGWEVWHVPQCTLRHAIAARRLNLKYLRALHYGFGLADPMLFGLRDSGTLLGWGIRFGRFSIHRSLLWVRLWFRGWSDSEARLDADLVLTGLRAAFHGLTAVKQLTPAQRSLWLGRPPTPAGRPASNRSIESAPSVSGSPT
jgi:glycosyltransferase involved in cell wall biosynthesis